MVKRRRNDELVRAIGVRLREIRKSKGLSIINVYIDTDIHIARVEMGRYNVTISTLSDLCDYYEISLEAFFKELDVKK